MSELERLTEENACLRSALSEIERRTSLLIYQNTGRWNMRVEHDRRTSAVLLTNNAIALEALIKNREPSDV